MARAARHAVPAVNNTNVDRSVATIHATVLGCLRRQARVRLGAWGAVTGSVSRPLNLLATSPASPSTSWALSRHVPISLYMDEAPRTEALCLATVVAESDRDFSG